MKSIKKILWLFILALTFTFVACSKEEEPKLEQNTEYTDALKLTSSYEGTSFLNDGIGKVTLYQCVDGDTAHFNDSKSGKNFTARFLCINTPESTGRIDPWGKAASKFVAEKLTSAVEIVCESKVNGQAAELDSTLKRYLSYVWYKTDANSDFRLLNLELIEEGYTKFTDVETEVKYGDVFQKAHLKSYELKIKDYGEKDPNYDYSGDIKEVTIAEVRNNVDSYSGGTTLKITARIMRVVGDNLYLQDLRETENDETGDITFGSIYMFSGYGSGLGRVDAGKVISFECQCTINEIYGTQLTNPNRVKIVQNDDEPYITELDSTKNIELGHYEGYVVSIKGLKVVDLWRPNDEGAYTIFCETVTGQKINVRIDGDVNPKYPYSEVEVGATYDVIGGVSKYEDSFQIMLANQKGIAENDFVISK